MNNLITKLREMNKSLIEVTEEMTQKGSSYQNRLFVKLQDEINILRRDIERDMKYEGSAKSKLAIEIIEGIEETVIRTGKCYKDVLTEAEEIYKLGVKDIDNKERFANLFKKEERHEPSYETKKRERS